MKSENDLLGLLENEDNIIIYGAGGWADVVVARMKTYDFKKSIYVAVTKKYIRRYCCDLVIHDFSELKHLADSSVVILTTRPTSHDEMEEHAKSQGFNNIIRLNYSTFHDIKYRYNTENAMLREQKKIRFFQYQTMNLIRLNNLREKVRNDGKVNVMFILTDKTKFNFTSVYWAMEKNPLFEVSLLVFSDVYNIGQMQSKFEIMREFKEYSDDLKQQGYNIIWGHDSNGGIIPFENYPIDIIFYNNCYMYLKIGVGNHLQKVVTNHLSCYVSYGMLMSRQYSYHFENEDIMPAWLFFTANRQEYDLSTNFISGKHAVLSGHPLFDDYTKDIGFSLPPKLRNKKKIIIYAPHWSMDASFDSSTFHILGNYILSLLKEYPDFGFVFKPHPRLSVELSWRSSTWVGSGLPNYSEWQEYCDTWESSPNGVIVNDSSYIHWFKSSDCLITDSYSFILSWLPTEKPCIYLRKPKSNADFFYSYLDHIRPVLESYYLCDSKEELHKLIETVLIEGKDEKADERKRQKDDVIYNLGHAGEFIVDYIEKQLRD